jgi:hypothetical protein
MPLLTVRAVEAFRPKAEPFDLDLQSASIAWTSWKLPIGSPNSSEWPDTTPDGGLRPLCGSDFREVNGGFWSDAVGRVGPKRDLTSTAMGMRCCHGGAELMA